MNLFTFIKNPISINDNYYNLSIMKLNTSITNLAYGLYSTAYEQIVGKSEDNKDTKKNNCIFAPENKEELTSLLSDSIKHPAIPSLVKQLTENHECSGEVVSYHAPVIKGAVMPLCEVAKEKLGAIHPLTSSGKDINFENFRVRK